MSEPCILQAADGYPLAASFFRPAAGREKAIVIVNGATGVRRRFYDRFALYLADRGFLTVTYDYRGIGDSRLNTLNLPLTMEAWGSRDFDGVLRFVHGLRSDLPIFVVGHSVGGQIVGLAEHNWIVDGAVAVGAQSGYWRHWPVRAQRRMAFNWHVMIPALVTLFGELPGWAGTGQPLPAGVARQWARWCRHPDFLFGEDPARRRGFEQISIPMLVLGMDADPYAPPAAVDAFARFYPRATVDRRHLNDPRLGHFDFFRPQQEALWGEVDHWFRGLLSARAEAA